MAETNGGRASSKKQSRYEKDPFNEYQNFLYNRALNGLNTYDKDEVTAMAYNKKKRIVKVHKRAQTIINLWKQHVVNVLSNHLFQTIFPDSPLTKELVEDLGSHTDETYINKIPLKLLQIKKINVIDRFIEEGILPKNFHELKPKQENENRISSGGGQSMSSSQSREYA